MKEQGKCENNRKVGVRVMTTSSSEVGKGQQIPKECYGTINMYITSVSNGQYKS